MGLPQSTATLYLQPDGTYLATSSGVAGEVASLVAVTDAVCVDDLDPNGNETTSDAQALAQDVYHVLLEVVGSNLDDLNRGLGVEGYASAPSSKLALLPSICDSQLQKDTRITSSRTTLVQTSTAPMAFTLSIQIIASGEVIPLAFLYTPTTGLVPS